MIAKNEIFEKYMKLMSISFSLLYYFNTALALFITESSHNYTGYFTVFFVLYAIDKVLTFVIAKAWQYKEGFFTWLLDCFNIGFFAVIYYCHYKKNNFKNIYRLKMLISIIPMTILQIVYFFNEGLIYEHIIEDQSIRISQMVITNVIISIVLISFGFTQSMQKPNIYYQDHQHNLICISTFQYFRVFMYNLIHFLSYFGIWILLASQKFYYYNRLSLSIIAAGIVLVLTIFEIILIQNPVPLLNIFFNHPCLNQKALKDSVQSMKQSRIRPIRCFVQLLSMVLTSIFLSEGNPFSTQSYEQSQAQNNYISTVFLEVYRFDMFIYVISMFCLVINLKELKEVFTCYWIDEESTASFSAIIKKLNDNPKFKYVYINTLRRGSSRLSLNSPLIFDDEETQTRASYRDSDDYENQEIANLKTIFLDRLVKIQSEGGIVCINKTILVKTDSFMIDKDLFTQNNVISYLSKTKYLPLNFSYKLEKQQLEQILKARLLSFGVETSQNVINLITNNEKYRNDKTLKFTSNYFSSNIHQCIAFNNQLSPFLINLPAQILYDLHEM